MFGESGNRLYQSVQNESLERLSHTRDSFKFGCNRKLRSHPRPLWSALSAELYFSNFQSASSIPSRARGRNTIFIPRPWDPDIKYPCYLDRLNGSRYAKIKTRVLITRNTREVQLYSYSARKSAPYILLTPFSLSRLSTCLAWVMFLFYDDSKRG